MLHLCMFKAASSQEHDDMLDHASSAADVLGADWDGVVKCLKMTWQPLRLSRTYHLTLVTANALEAFRKQPSESVLHVLLDSVPDLQEITRASPGATYSQVEIDTTKSAFREIKIYCKSRMHDMMQHFTCEQGNLVGILSELYCWTAPVRLNLVDDPVEGCVSEELVPTELLTSAIKDSVMEYYRRLKDRAENDSDEEEYDEDEEDKFVKLALVAEKLGDDLDVGTFETLHNSVVIRSGAPPAADGIPEGDPDSFGDVKPEPLSIGLCGRV
jgi:hypothetical protein|eukprot:COSAG02_NODE_2645_length_8340_cov_6.038709_3_plen_271_part_00